MTALQCPGCGHIHNSGEAESGRTFRCAGCRRLLSVPASVLSERSEMARGTVRRTVGDDTDDSFPLFRPGTAPGPASTWTRPAPGPSPAPAGGERRQPDGNGRAGTAWPEPDFDSDDETGSGELPRPAPSRGARREQSTGFERPARPEAPKRERRSPFVPVWQRGLIWSAALGVGLVVVAFALRAIGILDVDSVIDAYAGSGISRYRVVLILVPLWAALSSVLAHVVLEWVARRRRTEGSGVHHSAES